MVGRSIEIAFGFHRHGDRVCARDKVLTGVSRGVSDESAHTVVRQSSIYYSRARCIEARAGCGG